MAKRIGMRAKWAAMINNGMDARQLSASIADRLETYAAEIGDYGLLEFLEAYWG